MILSLCVVEEERQDMLVVLDAQSQFFKEVYALRCKWLTIAYPFQSFFRVCLSNFATKF